MPDDRHNLVQRLRAPPVVERCESLLLEAADEIMQLRKRIALLKEIIEEEEDKYA